MASRSVRASGSCGVRPGRALGPGKGGGLRGRCFFMYQSDRAFR